MIRKFFNTISYKPSILSNIDEVQLLNQASSFFNLQIDEVQDLYASYSRFSEEKKYSEILGENKTLSFEESFLLLLTALLLKPGKIVEIGTQYGKSTRRIVDITQYLNLNAQVTCFDIVDLIKYVSHDEVDLRIHDLTIDFNEQIFLNIKPSLIFLDAHPFALLKIAVNDFLNWSTENQCILAIHDCSKGFYRENMKIHPNDPTMVTSRSGLWERHVLQEVFSTSNDNLEDLQTENHHLKIFETSHGLAIIAPNSVLRR